MYVDMIEKSKEYKKMGDELIRKVPELKWIKECGIKIVWMDSTEKKMKSRGHGIVYAECKMLPKWVQALAPYDFAIIVYSDNCLGLTENQMRILLWHELLHIGIEEEGLNPIYMTNPHDIEEFRSIIGKFGLDWVELGEDTPNVWDVVNGNRETNEEPGEREKDTIQKWGETGGNFQKRRNSIRNIKTEIEVT